MPKPMCSSNVRVATKLFCTESVRCASYTIRVTLFQSGVYLTLYVFSVRCVSYTIRVTLFLQNLMKVIKLTYAPSSIPYTPPPPPPPPPTCTKGAVTYLFCVVTMFFFRDTDVLIHCKQTNIIHQLPSIHFSWTSTVMHQNEQNAIMFLQVRERDSVCGSVCVCSMYAWDSVCHCVCAWKRGSERQRHTDSERETCSPLASGRSTLGAHTSMAPAPLSKAWSADKPVKYLFLIYYY